MHCTPPRLPVTLVSRDRLDRQTAKSDKSLQTVVTGSLSGILLHLMAASAQVCALLQRIQETVLGATETEKRKQTKKLQTQITNGIRAAQQPIGKADLLPQRIGSRAILRNVIFPFYLFLSFRDVWLHRRADHRSAAHLSPTST